MKWNYLTDFKRKLVSKLQKHISVTCTWCRLSSGDPGANNELSRCIVSRTMSMSIVQAEPFQIQVLHRLILHGITSQVYTSNHLEHNVSTRDKLFNLITRVEMIVFVSMDKVRWYSTNRCYATKQLCIEKFTWYLIPSLK